ncbi:hypothetical protein KKI24_01155 [bacterium]|nr:hypothetical protein [bacterium]
MKPKIFSVCLITAALLIFGFSASAESNFSGKVTPKYTDKETALELARVLDKGTFGRYTISSAYVQNENVSDYYISVILSDGSAQKWYIDQIYKWSRDDRLLLNNNRALLFLDPTDSHFVVLDKNKFHRLALKANVFRKVFKDEDPLAGKKFRFYIKAFSLISPTETAFGRDESGSKYRYIIDLYNGIRELLTYEDVYRILENEDLTFEENVDSTTFKNAYHVTKIVAYPKSDPEDGVSQFGVEIQFDQPILTEGEQFPYQIYERKIFQKNNKEGGKEFIIDITIPNSEKKFEIQPIGNLEYLQDIKIVKDPQYPKRLLLRTTFNPTVMDIPPLIYKNSDNSVYVNFFNFVDQTILSRGMLLEAKKRKESEQESIKKIRITKAIKQDSDYGRAFIVALETQKEAQTIINPEEKINKLLLGIKQFEQAALYSEKDSQLYNALAKRNQLKENVIAISLDFIKSRLSKQEVGAGDAQRLISLLDQAESFTRRQQVLTEIDRLREQLTAVR